MFHSISLIGPVLRTPTYMKYLNFCQCNDVCHGNYTRGSGGTHLVPVCRKCGTRNNNAAEYWPYSKIFCADLAQIDPVIWLISRRKYQVSCRSWWLLQPNHNHHIFAALAHSTSDLSYYEILAVDKSASLLDIKQAYHRALLASHPDKHVSGSISPSSPVNISTLKDAYTTLSSDALKREYDARQRSSERDIKYGPRPAQVVSLEDFTVLADEDTWVYQCRCGDSYRIDGQDMDKGKHLVACESCSEVVWVGYELADGDE